MFELTLSLALLLAEPPAGAPGPVWSVDEGDLVVAWGESLDPRWLRPLAPDEQVKRPTRRLRSVARTLELGALPPDLRGLIGATVAVYTASGERCEARVDSLRARCLAIDHGVTDDDGVCRDRELDAARVCQDGQPYLLGTLVPARPGESLCDGRLATPIGAAPLHLFRPAPPSAEVDAEVLAAFRATRAWRAAEADFRAMDHPSPPTVPWDSFDTHRPRVGRFLPAPGDPRELAYAYADLSIDADGGAPTQRLAAVFTRAPGGPWALHRAYLPGPEPVGFFLDATGELRAWGRTTRFALRPGPDAKKGDRYEDLELPPPEELTDFAIPDLSDPACAPR